VKPRGGIPCPVLLLFPSSCSVASTTGLQGDHRPAGRVSLTFGRPDGRRHNDRQAQLCAQLQKAGLKAPGVRCIHRARAGSVDRESVFASAERPQLPHELSEVVFPGDGTAALAVAAVAGGGAAVPQVAVARRWKTCCRITDSCASGFSCLIENEDDFSTTGARQNHTGLTILVIEWQKGTTLRAPCISSPK
jgi:hypothetical protein